MPLPQTESVKSAPLPENIIGSLPGTQWFGVAKPETSATIRAFSYSRRTDADEDREQTAKRTTK